MDPNANLAEQSTLLDSQSNYDRRRLAELRRALLDWRGFEPTWADYPAATKQYRTWVRRSAQFADLAR